MSDHVKDQRVVFISHCAWSALLVHELFEFVVKTLHSLLLGVNLCDVGDLREVIRKQTKKIHLGRRFLCRIIIEISIGKHLLFNNQL